MGRLEGKSAVIAGGGTGIGRAAALLFAREGAAVAVAGRTRETGEETVEKVRERGGAALYIQTDAGDARQVDRLFAEAEKAHGSADIVFTTAGGSGRRFGDGPVHECSEEGWDETLRMNARVTFLMSRAAVRSMLRSGGGSVINTSSALADSPSPRLFATHAYAASKGAVVAMSRSMAAYYAPRGIRVNVIAPALIATPMSARAQSSAETAAYIRTKQPLTGTLGTPEDCAHAALYLASDESKFLTGVTLRVDGGWSVSEGQLERLGGA